MLIEKGICLGLSVLVLVSLVSSCSTASSTARDSIAVPNPVRDEVKRQGTPSSLQHVQFLTGSSWLVADGSHLWKTDDRGSTWRIVFPTNEVVNTGQPIRSLRFKDTKAGALIFNRSLFRSNDGGKSWQKISDFEPSFLADSCFFIDEKNGWVAGMRWNAGFMSNPETVQYSAAMLRTIDGGETWEEKLFALPKRLKGEKTVFRDVYFASAETGWVVGDGMIFFTEDGGKRWSLANGLPNELIKFNRIWDVDGKHVWVTSWQDNRIITSVNGGKDWRFSGFSHQFGNHDPTVAFASDQHAFVALAEIYETVDGGKSWRPRELLPEAPLDYIVGKAFDNTIIVLARNQYSQEIRAIASSNGGDSWF